MSAPPSSESGPPRAGKPRGQLGAYEPFVMAALSFAAGLAVALVLDYILYRFGLPSKPFIYVAF